MVLTHALTTEFVSLMVFGPRMLVLDLADYLIKNYEKFLELL
jgi:hypothetical protein